MKTMGSIFSNESGQSLMIGVMLVVILLITIPAIIFMNQTYTHHRVMSQNGTKGRSIAEEGVAVAIQQLSKPWNQAQPGNFGNWPYLAGGNLPAPGTVSLIPGEAFALTYSSWSTLSVPSSGLQSYQVGITARPADALCKIISGGSVFARVSQKTLSAKLPTGYSASAALEMMQVPLNPGGLVVHWGPAILLSPNQWTLGNAMNTNRFPRKFSQGDITGPFNLRSLGPLSPNTDNKEYWANTTLGFPNLINKAAYQLAAQNTTAPPSFSAPTSKASGSTSSVPLTCPVPGVTACTNFEPVTTDTAVFDNYTFNSSANNTVIYINGNAEFDKISMDLGNTGALIINGNLTLNNPTGGGQSLTLHMPPTAPLEYPYSPNAWPCVGNQNSNGTGTCDSTTTHLGVGDSTGLGTSSGNGLVHFRGFIYVTGDLIVLNPGWLFDGAMRVDGTINLAAAGTSPQLTLLYDDTINHHISATPLELQIDSTASIP